jgi:hypothetical protein
MALSKHDARKFTKAESFRLFMEGVRALHSYDSEADKDQPDEDLLNQHLGNAEKSFRDCVETYPNDLLPRYYFGIVLSTRGQIEQSRVLRSQLGEGQSSVDPDSLLLQAAKHFERITKQVGRGKSGRDLLVYAQYNQAQALAKTQPIPQINSNQESLNVSEGTRPQPETPDDDQMHWNAALRILQKIDPQLLAMRPSFKQRMAAWLHPRWGILGSKGRIGAQLNQHRRKASEVSGGVAIPLKEKKGEERAFEIQVRVLEYAIQLRKAVHGGRKLTLEDLPLDQETEKKHARAVAGASGIAGAGATVRDFVARIQEDPIPSKAQQDIVADYWNKLAFVAWERATLERGKVDVDWLKRARKYIDIARNGRSNWTPAQLNLARILEGEREEAEAEGKKAEAEGKKTEALDTLAKVLGTKRAKPAPSPPPPVPDSDAIAGVILKMAVERNPKAVAAHIQRSYGALSQETVRKITEALAGKVDAGLLDDILSGVAIKTEPVPN